MDTRFEFQSGNYEDISPLKNEGILKKLVSRGNGAKGYPQDGDLVLVDWVFYDENRNIIHDSIDLEETFYFTLGVAYQVIPAFEVAVRTMFEGETAFLKISPEYGFGDHGESMFQPNQTIYAEFVLEELVIGLRQYETVPEDYDIKDEIYRKIDSGEIDISDLPVMEEEENNGAQGKDSSTDSNAIETEIIPEKAKIPAKSIPSINVKTNTTSATNEKNSASAISGSHSMPQKASEGNEKEDKKRKFYNPETDQLDPRRSLKGIGEGHIWDETVEQIIVEVDLPDSLGKSDLHVEIR